MSYVLQSQSDTSLFFTGTTLTKKNITLALFDVTNRRVFDTEDEAIEVSETFDVPVNLIEI